MIEGVDRRRDLVSVTLLVVLSVGLTFAALAAFNGTHGISLSPGTCLALLIAAGGGALVFGYTRQSSR